jgi:hypothetical protein
LYFGSWPVTHIDLWFIYERFLTLPWTKMAFSRWNQHPAIFPFFLWLIDIDLFQGKQAALVWIGLLLMIGTVALLLVPVWRDKTVGFNERMIGTLVIVLGNFWMGRALITTSGVFNSVHYLTTLPVALAFLWLVKMGPDSAHFWRAAIIVLLSALVATFSYGTGVAVWPALLLLAWASRLSARSIVLLLTGAIIATIGVALLPSPQDNTEPSFMTQSPLGSVFNLLGWLCRLTGSPIAYAIAGWYPQSALHEITKYSAISLWAGVAGLLLTLLTATPTLLRRRAATGGCRFTGLALMSFNLFVLILIIFGRRQVFREYAIALGTPRYMFWSTLFWSGLLLTIIDHSQKWRYFRWPILWLILTIPVFLFPLHYRFALHYRYIRCLSDEAATSLINGVQDSKQVAILSHPYPPELIYSVAPLLRKHRLDMFAEGLQDWIGQPLDTIFHGRSRRAELKGSLRVQQLVENDKEVPAARIIGTASTPSASGPEQLVITNPSGTVCGIARVCATPRGLSQILYGGKFARRSFFGYIRNYDPNCQYLAHSVTHGTISTDTIVITNRPSAGAPLSPRLD